MKTVDFDTFLNIPIPFQMPAAEIRAAKLLIESKETLLHSALEELECKMQLLQSKCRHPKAYTAHNAVESYKKCSDCGWSEC